MNGITVKRKRFPKCIRVGIQVADTDAKVVSGQFLKLAGDTDCGLV